jgi:hypothetical protein
MTARHLAKRILEIEALASNPGIRHLAADEVTALHAEVLHVLEKGHRLETFDFSREGLDGPIPILARWLEAAQRCIAYWPFDREGIELACELFVGNFNDLWLPGEVVWLCSPRRRAAWWIMIGDDEITELWHFELAP